MRIIVHNDRDMPEDVDALATLLARQLRQLGFVVEFAEQPAEPGDVPIPNRVTDLSVRCRDAARAVVIQTKGKSMAKPKRERPTLSPEERAKVEARMAARVKPAEQPKPAPESPKPPRTRTKP